MDKELLLELAEYCEAINANCDICEKKDACIAYSDELADMSK